MHRSEELRGGVEVSGSSALPRRSVAPAGVLGLTSRPALLILFVLCASVLPQCCQSQGLILEITSVVGGTALLPCDIVPPLPNDSVILVIWFKNEITPIYSYDIRGKHSELASHWRDRDLLQQRGYFRTITEPATLALDDVRAEDEGDYRCRVDFRRSPTRNFKVRLNVVVPPQTPTIIDERGRELPSTAGPYSEGASMKLTCIVRGGRPKPVVSWWRGERLLPARDVPSPFPNVHKSQLLVAPLARSDLHSVFTCQAINSDLTPPAAARVALELHLRPLSATIMTERKALSAGRRVEVDCMSSGSRPAAKLSWWLDNQSLVGSVDKILGDGNVTTSTVRLNPSATDDGKVLTCRAENPAFPSGVEEDTWRLNVHYAPALRLELGSSLNPDDIEEGDDVYFECKVHANPKVYKVIWKNNGQIVHHNTKAGVLLINHDLALQGVRREQAGNYSCFASNVEGDGESNAVQLRVMYKPVCRAEQRRVYAVARLEPAQVTCEVDAFPPPDAFRWSFNHSGAGDATVEVPEARYSSPPSAADAAPASSTSTLAYAPMTELDYGTLLCLASNAAGQQREPCVFHIIPAGRPEAPLNCSLTNQTTGSLEVECEEGFDGGLPQSFALEVTELEGGLLAANVSSRWPRFLVEGLRPGRALRILAFAINAKGRSEPFHLEGFTLKKAEKHTGSPVALELTPLLATLLGALAALLLVATAVAAAAVALRKRARRGAAGGGGGAGGGGSGGGAAGPARPTELALKEKARGGQTLRADAAGMDFDGDEKNPDVIPCNKAVASVGRSGRLAKHHQQQQSYQQQQQLQLQLAQQQQRLEWERALAEAEYQLVETPGPLQGLLTPTPTPTYAAPPRVPSPRGPSPHCNGGLYATYCAPPAHLRFTPLRQGEEVQYAELALSRCGATPPPAPRSPSEPTVYAQISHTLRAGAGAGGGLGGGLGLSARPSPRCTPSPGAAAPPPHPAFQHPAAAHAHGREVVTVRTPLMMGDCAQESCV